jgi:hypothetical protein
VSFPYLPTANGDIWAGTDAGLSFYNTHEGAPKLNTIIDAEAGLMGNMTTSIREDQKETYGAVQLRCLQNNTRLL